MAVARGQKQRRPSGSEENANFGFLKKNGFSLAIGLFLVNSGETTDQRITEAEQE